MRVGNLVSVRYSEFNFHKELKKHCWMDQDFLNDGRLKQGQDCAIVTNLAIQKNWFSPFQDFFPQTPKQAFS